MKHFKKVLSVLLVLCMLLGVAPLGVLAADSATQADSDSDGFYKIVHLDAGRKYFTADWIKALINEMSAAGYTHLQLAFGNEGLRFLLDDMSLTVNDKTYSDADVTAAIQAGNKAYYDFGTNELTEAQMDDIIAYAQSKGIEIIPLLNTPGHMNAIVTALDKLGVSGSYNGSASTIDLTNETAVAFTKALVEKYAVYFAKKGSTVFHLGADEYANDVYSSGSMGFGHLVSNNLYDEFAAYVNDLAAIVKKYNMMPAAFNDGIYFQGITSFAFDTDIMISFWTTGWGNYCSLSASEMAAKGHKMLNTCGDYYYVLGKNDVYTSGNTTTHDPNLYTSVSSFSNTAFMGSTVSNPAGSTLCIWCDYPGAETETEIAENTRLILRAMAMRMNGQSIDNIDTSVVSGGFNADGTINVPAATTNAIPGVPAAMKVGDTVTLTLDKTATWESSDENVIALTAVTRAVESASVIANVVGTGRATITATTADGTVYSSDVTVLAEDGEVPEEDRTITVTIGQTATDVISGYNYSGTYTADPAGIASVTAVYEQKDGATVATKVTSITSGTAYLISDGNGNYLTLNGTSLTNTTDPAEATLWTVTGDSDGYTINSGDRYLRYYYYSLTTTTTAGNATTWSYSNNSGFYYTSSFFGSTTYYLRTNDSAWQASTTNSNNGAPYTLTTTEPVDQTTVTVTGDAVGTTTVKIGHVNYTINVVEEDLSIVTPMPIEYWMTNGRVVDGVNSTTMEYTVQASNAYSYDGINLTSFLPIAAYKKTSHTPVKYWRSRLLNRSTNEQTEGSGNDQTLNGISFTKIRYWDGAWAVYTENNEWVEVNAVDHQLVAYYMNDMNLADEVQVGTSDWGKKGDGTLAGEYLGSEHVSIAFQIVYEDGTTAPASATAADLASVTYLVDYRSTGRGIGSIFLNQIGDYQIWKVTAETGTHRTNYGGAWAAVTVTNFSWDDNEMTVYEGDAISEYTISNPAGNPSDEGYFENLQWDETNEAILIRIYVKAVETEDSLTVVYYDEKFGDTLYTYNISVESGVTFANITPAPGALGTNRINVTGCGIVNALGRTQNFQTDLTQVPEAVGKYNNALYTYTGSEISEDGKTLYLYYNIDTEVLSPNFVVDFGLPFTFNLTDMLGADQLTMVEEVTVIGARYGTLVYDGNTKTFTYTPTEVLPNIDILSISIQFEGEDATTTNVGVTPATTVDYEEGFADFSGTWTDTGSTGNGNQDAAIAGEDDNNYGYDDAYATANGASGGTAATTSAANATATLTFTGTGVTVYTNNTRTSGTLMVKLYDVEQNKLKRTVFVQTAMIDGETDATLGQSVNAYHVPVVALSGLEHGTYRLEIVNVNQSASAVAGTISIDGFRVYGSLEDQSNDVYTNDLEDDPVFIELRDQVLASLNADETTSDNASYTQQIAGNIYSQIYATGSKNGAVLISANNEFTADNLQDLLDNGPKNEIYLMPGQAIAFSVKTERVVQIGLKGVNGATTCTINGSAQSVSTIDMFYTLIAEPADNEATTAFTITNTGSTILSITQLKICDDPNFAFVALTEEDIVSALVSLGFADPNEPEEVYADATLTVKVNGTSVTLTQNGVVGESATFTAEEIEEAAAALVADGYDLDDVDFEDVEVAYGESDSVSFTATKTNSVHDFVSNILNFVWSFVSIVFGRR